MAKCIDQKHVCKSIEGDGDDPQYMVVRNLRREWEIWIPDFLRHEDTTVKAFVWQISFCPFCGCDLSDDKNSKVV
jgi:hypothetical protein